MYKRGYKDGKVDEYLKKMDLLSVILNIINNKKINIIIEFQNISCL